MRYDDARIARAIVKKYGCRPSQVQGLIRKVFSRWKAESAESRPSRRLQQIRALERVHRLAVEQKKLSVAVKCEELLARIEGNLEPERHELSVKINEFEDRSEEDLDHYATHGYFPDERKALPVESTIIDVAPEPDEEDGLELEAEDDLPMLPRPTSPQYVEDSTAPTASPENGAPTPVVVEMPILRRIEKP